MVISPSRFEFCGLVAVFFGEDYASAEGFDNPGNY